MWHKRTDCPLPSLHDGEEIEVTLKFSADYTYAQFLTQETIVAVWDETMEELFEKRTGVFIPDEEIISWRRVRRS